MKKLFIAAMALATIVSCSKDDGASILESSKKAVSITIVNGVNDVRAAAVVTTPVANDTNVGGVGTIQDQADGENKPCATVGELVVLFANANGTVEEAYSFASATETDGKNTYTWHNVSESVTQVAVVRDVDENGDVNTNLTSFKGQNISTYKAAAENVDAMENIDITDIDLYVSSTLGDSTGTCTVTDEHDNTTWTYQLYKVDVTIAPTIARVEIIGISCDVAECDEHTNHVSHVLGGTTLAAAQGTLVSGGYDQLALTNIKWGESEEYSYTFGTADVLKGIYAGNGNTTARPITNYVPTEAVAEGATADGTADAIVWNINPTAKVPQIGEGNYPMVLTMEASAYDYTVVNTTKTLSIGFGEAITSFAPGKIYRLAIPFGENNLDESNESICVEVKVIIANWVVVPVTPEFGNE